MWLEDFTEPLKHINDYVDVLLENLWVKKVYFGGIWVVLIVILIFQQFFTLSKDQRHKLKNGIPYILIIKS